jgi:hypothetical protein
MADSRVERRVSKVEENSPNLLADALAGGRSYHVPSRFGLLPLLVTTAILAITFAALRILESPPWVYGFLGTLALTVFVLQSYFPGTPRLVSALAGAALLLVWGMIFYASDWWAMARGNFAGGMAGLLTVLVGGGIVGYIVGALCAGVFLVLDMYRECGSWSEVCRTMQEQLKVSFESATVGTRKLTSGLVEQAGFLGAAYEVGGATPRFVDDVHGGHPHGAPSRGSHSLLCNCVLYVSRCSEDAYRARFAQLDWPPGYGTNARAAIQSAIMMFKHQACQCCMRGEAIPWLEQPYPKLPYEQEQWVAVYIYWRVPPPPRPKPLDPRQWIDGRVG